MLTPIKIMDHEKFALMLALGTLGAVKGITSANMMENKVNNSIRAVNEFERIANALKFKSK